MISVARILTYIVEYFASLYFTLTLFRLAYNKEIVFKIFAITTVMSCLFYYFSEIANMKPITILFLPMFVIVSCTVVFGTPIFYSFLLGFIFTTVGFITEFAVGILAELLGVTSVMNISSSIFHMTFVQLVTSIILFGLTYLINSRKFGFMFLKRHMQGRTALTPSNFIVAGLLVLTWAAVQINLFFLEKENYSIIHIATFFVISATLLAALFIAYRHNKRILNQRYNNSVGLINNEKSKRYR